MRDVWLSVIAIGALLAGVLLTAFILKSSFHQLHITEWTCVQPYGAPEHECRQWVRTVQRKVAH